MAGWLKRVDGSGLECFKTDQSFQKADNWLDLEPVSKASLKATEEGQDRIDKLQSSFDDFLFVFLQETFGPSCYRPLPPVLGDGQHVDLFKLYLTLRKQGGYELVSQKNLWVFVAIECGFDSTVGLALKLVYFKYLHEFSRALQRAATDKHSKSWARDGSGDHLMELESDLGRFLSENSDKENSDGGCINMGMRKTQMDFICNGMLSETGEHLHAKIERLSKNSGSIDNREANCFTKTRNVNNECRAVASHVIRGRSLVRGENTVPGSMVVEEDVCSSRKRGREFFAGMLKWINWVAKDPCDAAIGHIPESSSWKSYPNDMAWKQVLLLRDEMLLKKNVDSGDQQAPGQKKQKMHPFMYEEHTSSERLRYSQRLLSAKDTVKKSSSGNDEDEVDELSDSSAGSIPDFLARNHQHDQVPIGADYQAEVPEWRGETFESDNKWLGSRVWPLEERERKNNLIEREPIGKGRQDSCGCQYPGSQECVKFHVSEKRMRLKLEIGTAFYHWKFDKMGEEVAYSWSKGEEKEFHNIVKSNTSNHGKYFWDKLARTFPSKSKQSLVSYYFNVFLLQQRGQQNRATPNELNSDEEDSGFGAEAANPGSIFRSPKKAHH